MLSAQFSTFINHLLAPAGWARAILAEHAGKIALFEVFPLRVAVGVQPDGTLREAPATASPAAVIRLSHAAALQILAHREDAWRNAEVQGDTAFASAISKVAANLNWDIEEDLSKVFGDIAAHRIAEAGRLAATWPRQAATSFAGSVAEFLTEEQHLLVTPLRAGEFIREVDELRNAVERLDKRIERLRHLVSR